MKIYELSRPDLPISYAWTKQNRKVFDYEIGPEPHYFSLLKPEPHNFLLHYADEE
jgi:hypothetical protein